MSNYTPGYDRQVPKNLLEVAHEETGQWLKRDELETWVFRRFQRLEQQIKRLEEEHEAKVVQNIRLMRERDALAAHVERLRSALNYSSEYLYSSHLNTIGHGSKAHMEMVSALDDTPTTSLDRRDALKQAEALENLYNDIQRQNTGGMIRRGILLDRAIELRQQVEGRQ